MVRVKQFADDLAISKKQAKDLINKGRKPKRRWIANLGECNV